MAEPAGRAAGSRRAGRWSTTRGGGEGGARRRTRSALATVARAGREPRQLRRSAPARDGGGRPRAERKVT